MLVKDIITDTPKIFLLFRCYLFRFRLFQLIIRRGNFHNRLEFVTVFFAWSLAVFGASNLVVESLTGKKILELSGKLESLVVIHNGKKLDVSREQRPVVLQVLSDELSWRFDIGFNQRSVYVTPISGKTFEDTPCMVVDDKRHLVWPQSQVRAKFNEYRKLFTEECLADPRGYLILVRRSAFVISEGNLIEFASRLTLPQIRPLTSESIVAVPDRTCFSNGAYSACFEFLDASQLSAAVGFIIMAIFALTYSVCLATVDRLWFGVNFIDSTLSFLILNMTCIVFGGVVALISVAIDQLFDKDMTILGVGCIVLLLIFHLFRAAMFFGHKTPQRKHNRIIALVSGILMSWTLGIVLFFPLQVGVILFHDVVVGLL